jgi:hypothetical protein
VEANLTILEEPIQEPGADCPDAQVDPADSPPSVGTTINNSGLYSFFDTPPSYDTVRVFLGGVIRLPIYELHRVLARERTECQNLSITTRIRNMRIYHRPKGLAIEGSLPIFLKKTNVLPLHLEDIKLAFEELSDALHVDVSAGTVRRLDIGATFTVDHPVEEYFSLLAALRRCDRKLYPKATLYLQNKTKCLMFYDKVRQISSLSDGLVNIPENLRDPFSSSNVLRYEYQCRKIENLFHSGLRASSLKDPGVYSSMALRWYKDYRAIIKDVTSFGDHTESYSLPIFKRDLIAVGAKKVGVTRVFEHLENLARRRVITRTQKSRFLREVKASLGAGRNSAKRALLEELNRKLDRAYQSSCDQAVV